MKKSLIPLILLVAILGGCGTSGCDKKGGTHTTLDTMQAVPGAPTTSIEPPSAVGGPIKLYTRAGLPQHNAIVTVVFPADAAGQQVTIIDQAGNPQPMTPLMAGNVKCQVVLVPVTPNYLLITPTGAAYTGFNAIPPAKTNNGVMVVNYNDAANTNSVVITVQEQH